MGNDMSNDVKHMTGKNSTVQKSYTKYPDGKIRTELTVEGGRDTKRIEVKEFDVDGSIITEAQIKGKADCELFEQCSEQGNCKLAHKRIHDVMAYCDAYSDLLRKMHIPKFEVTKDEKKDGDVKQEMKGISYTAPLYLTDESKK